LTHRHTHTHATYVDGEQRPLFNKQMATEAAARPTARAAAGARDENADADAVAARPSAERDAERQARPQQPRPADADDRTAALARAVLEPLAIAVCVLSISGAILYYSATVTPAIFQSHGPLTGALHTCFGLSLVWAFAASYARLLATPPGTTRALAADRRALLLAAAARGGADWRHCVPCGLPKPPLAHHCSRCGACVFRADHHCLWVGRCVGWANHRHYLLFLLYLSLGSGYACATTYAVFGEAAAHDPWAHRWRVALALLSGGLSLALAALLGWHAACVAWGVGTLEMMDRVLGWHGVGEEDEGDSDSEEAEEEEAEEEGAEEGAAHGSAAETDGGAAEPGRRRAQSAPRPPAARRPPSPLPPHVAVAHLRDYPWNLGLERNVRLAFDLGEGGGGEGGGGGGEGGGRLWWLRCLRVHGAPRGGDGWTFETQQQQKGQRQQGQQQQEGRAGESKKTA